LAIVCPRPRFAFSPWHDFDARRLELEQRLPPDPLARRLDVAVDRLDLSAFRDGYGRTGSPAYATVPRPGWMAPTPEGRRRQQERLGRTRERMDELQRRNAGKRSSKRKKRERVVVSPSDPEAALGRDKEGVFRPLYNVQVVDDLDSPLILAYDVLAQANDAGLLGPMLARLRQALGRPLRTLLADSAYAGGADLAAAAAAGVTVYAPSPPATGGDRRQLPKAEFQWLAEEQAYRCPRG
jgi:hypothetical protein